MSVFLGFASLTAFIYFIHKISNEVQIGNILNGLYRTTRDVLDRELNSGSYYAKWEENETFFLVQAWESGHFDSITKRGFMKRAGKIGLKLRFLKDQGTYLLKGEAFLEINKPMTEEIKVLLEENIILRHQELVKDNFFYGFKHLTEIALKALSPAVNDPGTAIQAIDYLSDLLCRLGHLNGQKVVKHGDGTACIIYAPIPLEEVFYLCIASISAYSAQHVAVQARLINMIIKIREQDKQDKLKSLLEKELSSIEEIAVKSMNSKKDVEYITALLKKAKKAPVSIS